MLTAQCCIIPPDRAAAAVVAFLKELEAAGTGVRIVDCSYLTITIAAASEADVAAMVQQLRGLLDKLRHPPTPSRREPRVDPLPRVLQAFANSPEPLTRRQLSTQLGLSYGLIWRRIERLLADGLIEEAGLTPTRPHSQSSQLYRLASSNKDPRGPVRIGRYAAAQRDME